MQNWPLPNFSSHDVSCFASLPRWLTDGKYYEDLHEDENGVSFFTLTVNKEMTAVRCEAQNRHNIDQRTAYVTIAKGNQFSHFQGLWFRGVLISFKGLRCMFFIFLSVVCPKPLLQNEAWYTHELYLHNYEVLIGDYLTIFTEPAQANNVLV